LHATILPEVDINCCWF